MQVIGIVKVINDMKDIKYYIGTSIGGGQQADEQYIAEYGAKFSKEAGEKLL